MKQVIVYGGAFNPPTNAHQAIIRRLAGLAGTRGADLWLLPSGERTDKTISQSRALRLAYLEALCDGLAEHRVPIRIEPCELDSSQMTETSATVQALQQRYPDVSFTWVFGSDCVQTMRQWHQGDALWRTLPMIVIDRPGFQLSHLPPRAVRVAVAGQTVSSTQVRSELSAGHPVAHLVPPAVLRLLPLLQ